MCHEAVWRSGDAWDKPTASRPAYRILKAESSFGKQMRDRG
ncbi:MAG TPA: hypothetical protein V6C50_05705 [Crinalium sp.]